MEGNQQGTTPSKQRHKRNISESSATPSPLKKRQTIGSESPEAPQSPLARGTSLRLASSETPSSSPLARPSPASASRRSAAAASSGNPINVVLRIRPLLAGEKQSPTFTVGADGTVTVARTAEKKTFTFSKVLGQEATQADVFSAVAVDIVARVLEGSDGVIFCYGTTNAGKSFTVTGGPGGDSGLVIRIAESLLAKVGSLGEDLSGTQIVFSFAEVYQEGVYDLLADQASRESLQIAEDPKTGKVIVRGISEVPITCLKDAWAAVRKGTASRQTATTGANRDSSRSHGVLTLKLIRQPNKENAGAAVPGSATETWGSLTVVDMAGSERACRTNASGVRLQEAAAINTSLLVFGRCFAALLSNQQHLSGSQSVVPFRESKLTRMLQDAFTDKATSVALIVNASPADDSTGETANALQFGSLAQSIIRDDRLAVAAASPLRRASVARVVKERDSLARERADLERGLRESSTAAEALAAELATARADRDMMAEELLAARKKIADLVKENKSLEEELRFSRDHFSTVLELLSSSSGGSS